METKIVKLINEQTDHIKRALISIREELGTDTYKTITEQIIGEIILFTSIDATLQEELAREIHEKIQRRNKEK